MVPSIAYVSLLSTATGCVYVGSYLALHTPLKTRELRKAAGKRVNEDEEERQTQSLSSDSAWLLPVLGSVVLFTLYLAFRYFDKNMVNLLLGLYFTVAGGIAIPSVVEQAAKAFSGTKPAYLDALLLRVRIRWLGRFGYVDIDFLGFVMMGAYLYTRHWVLTNIVAVCIAIQGITLMTLDSFVTGFILLGGLFFYDIFWVFGSARLVKSGPSVMVSVATHFDGPIKILCPKNVVDVATALFQRRPLPAWTFALLGLGDIVVPGVFVALALRFDQLHASTARPGLHFTRYYYDFPKPYFTACLAAYIAGLVTTMGVMHFFGAAQPALLYLSPACALSVVLVALQRHELAELWRWVDHSTELTPDTPKTE